MARKNGNATRRVQVKGRDRAMTQARNLKYAACDFDPDSLTRELLGTTHRERTLLTTRPFTR